MRCFTGSQCRVSRIGWMWSDLAVFTVNQFTFARFVFAIKWLKFAMLVFTVDWFKFAMFVLVVNQFKFAALVLTIKFIGSS